MHAPSSQHVPLHCWPVGTSLGESAVLYARRAEADAILHAPCMHASLITAPPSRSKPLPEQTIDLRPYEEVKQEQAAAARKGWRGLLAAAQQHKTLLLGVLVVLVAGGAFLHQQGVFAAAAAKLQAAAAAAQRLWAVAVELVQ